MHNSNSRNSSSEAVLRTFAYAAVFDVVPSLSQVTRWLVSSQDHPSTEISRAYFFWKKRLGLRSHLRSRSTLTGEWRAVIREIFRLQRLLERLPWVQAAWVTGSVAAEHLQGNDDVDILVLTQENRLWVTRAVLAAWSVIVGKYRPRLVSARSSVRQKWCWNLWLEPSSLGEFGKPSLYVARELAQAKLIFRRQDVSVDVLISSAPWMREYVFAAWKSRYSFSASTYLAPASPEPRVLSTVLNRLNNLAFLGQRWYMKPHQTWERVTLHDAWFHPTSLAAKVQNQYETILSNWYTMDHFLTTFSWPSDWTTSEQQVLRDVAMQVERAHQAGKRVVLATGVFDLFHTEHQGFLQAAAAEGDVLLVGLESDVRTRALKGPGRPKQSQDQRRQQVAKFPHVSNAFILPEAFSLPSHHRAIIEVLRPDILAVSSHSPHQDKKSALLKELGGELRVVYEQNPAVSTTQILSVQ